MNNYFKRIYTAFPTVIGRVPLYPLSQLFEYYNSKDQDELLRQLLSDKFFVSALYHASPELHAQIENWQGGLKLDNKNANKLKITIIKYFIRACFRCTPFGLFASCTDLELALKTDHSVSELERLELSVRLDMSVLVSLYLKLMNSAQIKKELKYIINPSIYEHRDHYRYYSVPISYNNYSINVNEVSATKLVNSIFEYTQQWRTWSELYEYIKENFGSHEKYVKALDRLIDEEILISQLYPNITGEEYQNVLFSGVLLYSKDQDLIDAISNLNHTLNTCNVNNLIDIDKSVCNILNSLGIVYSVGKTLQVDSYRPSVSNHNKIDANIVESITRCSTILYLINSKNHTENRLARFIDEFYNKYENRVVPLMEALDPEVGVKNSNYIPDLDSPLLNGLENEPSFDFSENHQLVIDKLKFNIYKRYLKNNLRVQLITDDDLDNFDWTALSVNNLPDTGSVIAKVVHDKNSELPDQQILILTSAINGSSASNLLTRFGYLNQNIENLIDQIFIAEENHASDYILAEIVHLPEHRIGNILMRKNKRKYEIPFICKSTNDVSNQIQLKDLYIYIKNKEIILWSKSLDKRVVPKLSSAHNYSFSQHSIYKFLCDVQNQFTQPNYWDWGSLNQEVYLPRVQYKNIIISLARWLIEVNSIRKAIRRSTSKITSSDLKAYLDALKIDRFVQYSVGDNALLLDTTNQYCQEIMLKELNKQGRIFLSESIYSMVPEFTNKSKTYYNSEYLISFHKNTKPNDKIATAQVKPQIESNDIQRIFLPTDQWYYYKIYCAKTYFNTLLINSLGDLLLNLCKTSNVVSWFYLRYADPQDHIRLRIKFNDKTDIKEVHNLINSKLVPLVEKGIIENVQIDSYRRELERYGPEFIELTESLFHLNSEDSIIIIKNSVKFRDKNRHWLIVISYINLILKYAFLDEVEILKFLQHKSRIRNSYLNLSKYQTKRINDRYYKNRTAIIKFLEDELTWQIGLEDLHIKSEEFITLIDQIKGDNNQLDFNWTSSFIHMFCNRVFKTNSNLHEAILYEYLCKHYKSLSAKNQMLPK